MCSTERGFEFRRITFLLVFLTVFVGAIVTEVSSTSRHISKLRKRMNYYKKHAVKSIHSEDGDIIDCIEIYKQPAFDHPALKAHKIQMTPNHGLTMDTEAVRNNSSSKEKPSVNYTSQLWRRNGSCPQGTIPIRRIRTQHLLNHKLTESFGKKGPSFPFGKLRKPYDSKDSNTLTVNRSVAMLLTEGFNYNAAHAEIKVWNPHIERDDEYSSSRIALKNGPYNNYESIEAGWAVNPGVYGDRQTRIYVYWTVDGSNMTGCFDQFCAGFVQTSNEVALGGVIQSIPVPGGVPWIMTILIFKDPVTKNWWLRYQEKVDIGYWPAELFESLSTTAETVQWGGEVYSSRVGHPGHTLTEMGSGELADSLAQRSGWTKQMRIGDNAMVLKYPGWVYAYSDDYDCYSVFLNWEYMVDPEFYFGGPGKGWESWRCT